MNVNASVNKVVLRHLPTNVVAMAHDDRSIVRNEKIAWRRLRQKVSVTLNFRIRRWTST